MKNKPNFFFDNRGFPNWGGGGGHSEAIGESEPDPVHNLIGMTALVMWPKLLYLVK